MKAALFFWLDTVDLAKERVKQRVLEGGHSIADAIIDRRYKNGLKNFFTLYKNIVDYWLFIDNSQTEQELIAEGRNEKDMAVYNIQKWLTIRKNVYDEQN